MALTDVLQLLAEGQRMTNPVYRERQKVLQQQLFEKKQNEYNRSTPTWYEQQEVNRQQGLDKQAQQDRQYNFMTKTGELESKGVLQRLNDDGSDANPSETGPSTPAPLDMTAAHNPPVAATGPADAMTNGQGGAGPGASNGALTPTAAANRGQENTGGVTSGGGPSAPPIASLLGLPQGPLSGGIGGAPAGNTEATTQASRASSAQAGPLAQLNQGSVTPSTTASGESGSGSGPLPSPAQKAARQPDLVSPDGKIKYRFTTPDEQVTRQAATAQKVAAAQRDLKRQNLSDWMAKNPDLDPEDAKILTLENETGLKMPEITLQQQEGKLMARAIKQQQAGDTPGMKSTLDILSDIHQRQSAGPQTQMINSKGETALATPGKVFPPEEGWKPINQNQNIGPGAGTMMMVPDGKGGFTAQLVKSGDTVQPGSRIASQVGPTTQSRNMTEQAALVSPQITRIVKEIDDNRDLLGPAMGQAQGFYVNKMGMNGPRFAGLDSDLNFAASGLLRPHFGGRIPVQVLQDMQTHLKEAQSPDDLIARLNSYNTWLGGYAGANQGKDYMKDYKPDPVGDTYQQLSTGNKNSTTSRQATAADVDKYVKDRANWTNGKVDKAKVAAAMTKDGLTGF